MAQWAAAPGDGSSELSTLENVLQIGLALTGLVAALLAAGWSVSYRAPRRAWTALAIAVVCLAAYVPLITWLLDRATP